MSNQEINLAYDNLMESNISARIVEDNPDYRLHCPVCGSTEMHFDCYTNLVCGTCGYTESGLFT
ncbi:MAG: hypothetical protein C0391_03570 [Anaerolinea sp.]|nr:hypothetical protein [Anaerolinea sp.]